MHNLSMKPYRKTYIITFLMAHKWDKEVMNTGGNESDDIDTHFEQCKASDGKGSHVQNLSVTAQCPSL